MTRKIATENEPLTDAERLRNIEIALRKRGLLPSQLLKLEKLREQLRKRSREVSGEVIAEDSSKRPESNWNAKLKAALAANPDLTFAQCVAIADGQPIPDVPMTYRLGIAGKVVEAGDTFQLEHRVREALKKRWVPPVKPAEPAAPGVAVHTALGMEVG